MTDISDKPRRFRVWLDRNVVGVDPDEHTITVEAGEDADEVCAGVLQEMINTECYSGWDEEKVGDGE